MSATPVPFAPDTLETIRRAFRFACRVRFATFIFFCTTLFETETTCSNMHPRSRSGADEPPDRNPRRLVPPPWFQFKFTWIGWSPPPFFSDTVRLSPVLASVSGSMKPPAHSATWW